VPRKPTTDAQKNEAPQVETRAVRCPSCERAFTTSPARPFCSERCKLIDLGRWLGEEYAVAGEPAVVVDDGEA